MLLVMLFILNQVVVFTLDLPCGDSLYILSKKESFFILGDVRLQYAVSTCQFTIPHIMPPDLTNKCSVMGIPLRCENEICKPEITWEEGAAGRKEPLTRMLEMQPILKLLWHHRNVNVIQTVWLRVDGRVHVGGGAVDMWTSFSAESPLKVRCPQQYGEAEESAQKAPHPGLLYFIQGHVSQGRLNAVVSSGISS